MTAAQFTERLSLLKSILTDENDVLLIARAIQETRVSKFTKTERNHLSVLITVVTGYKIEGGI